MYIANIAQISKQVGLSHLSGFVEELWKLGKPHEDLNGTLSGTLELKLRSTVSMLQ